MSFLFNITIAASRLTPCQRRHAAIYGYSSSCFVQFCCVIRCRKAAFSLTARSPVKLSIRVPPFSFCTSWPQLTTTCLTAAWLTSADRIASSRVYTHVLGVSLKAPYQKRVAFDLVLIPFHSTVVIVCEWHGAVFRLRYNTTIYRPELKCVLCRGTARIHSLDYLLNYRSVSRLSCQQFYRPNCSSRGILFFFVPYTWDVCQTSYVLHVWRHR